MATATVERDGDILRVRGELDFDSVAELWTAANPLFATESFAYIDLRDVERSNSAGVALLVEWLRQAQTLQRDLRFIHVPAQMRAIIQVVDLETVLPIH